MIQKNIYLKNIEQTEILAAKLAKELVKGDIVTFKGTLGAGKTTFIKALIKSLVKEDIDVTSPTFNLLHLYRADSIEIWHFDLYRLKNTIEIYELGIEDAFQYGISLIEWPEIITNILPEDRINIEISFTDEENARIINFSSDSIKWQRIINNTL